jgi:hypothetical protein
MGVLSVSPTELFAWHAFLIAVLIGFLGCAYLGFKFMRGIYRKVTR